MITPKTHAELVEIGARYLRARGCSVVMTELTSISDIPDVLGFKDALSTQIEVKVSAADFRRDRKKTTRRHPELGVGRQRFYLVPEDLVVKVESLLPAGWGLLYYSQRRHCVDQQVMSSLFDVDREDELRMLISLVRRIAGERKPLKGVEVKCYVDFSAGERWEIEREYRRQGQEIGPAELAAIEARLTPRAALYVHAEHEG